MSFSAKIILDSINPFNGIRLVTSELTYPRFIHSEFLTHRVFSRNAASSRAIPVKKMIQHVESDYVMPIFWGKNQKGMSAKHELDEENIKLAKELWLEAKNNMIDTAKKFNRLKVHKQIANRVLEPWKFITIICTATQFSNFFALRDHEDAQPEIRHIAKLWKQALNQSKPVERIWHMPYIQKDEENLDTKLKAKISVARCARVSYLTHNGVRDINKDLELYERLLTGSGHGHWSPFEHVAMATDKMEKRYNFATDSYYDSPIQCGNFTGWIQYRKLFSRECQ